MPFSIRRASVAGLGMLFALAAVPVSQGLAQETPPPAAADPAATPVDPEAVVATINGKPITEADLKIAEDDLDQQFSRPISAARPPFRRPSKSGLWQLRQRPRASTRNRISSVA